MKCGWRWECLNRNARHIRNKALNIPLGRLGAHWLLSVQASFSLPQLHGRRRARRDATLRLTRWASHNSPFDHKDSEKGSTPAASRSRCWSGFVAPAGEWRRMVGNGSCCSTAIGILRLYTVLPSSGRQTLKQMYQGYRWSHHMKPLCSSACTALSRKRSTYKNNLLQGKQLISRSIKWQIS
jgi:hypothetical protein